MSYFSGNVISAQTYKNYNYSQIRNKSTNAHVRVLILTFTRYPTYVNIYNILRVYNVKMQITGWI